MLQLKGASIGTTVVHIWDSEGRATVQIRVIPQKSIAQFIRRQEERVERADSFKVEYVNSHSQFYQGNDFEDLAQTSLTYTQGFRVTGDTPVGHLEGSAEIREIANKPELSTISAKISDFHYGNVKDADLSLMDTNLRTDTQILPQYRFRGVEWDHRPEGRPYQYTAFYGRELTSILGTLGTSTDGGQTTLDSYVGGGFLDWDALPFARYRFGALGAHGQSRAEELNDAGFEFDQNYTISKHMDVLTRSGFDGDHFSHRVAGVWRYPQLDFKTEYRDTSKRYFTMIGNPAGQGEQGVASNMRWAINSQWDANLGLDVYRDRQFFFPGEYDRFNLRQDANLRWRPASLTSFQFDVKDYEETALISPYRNQEQSISYTQGVQLGDRRVTLYSRIGNETYESLSNEESNYRRHTLGLGASTMVFKDTYFSYQHNITLLEETYLHDVSHPRSMVYEISHRKRLEDTPISVDFLMRYTDEEETEALRSFMIGEDRMEISAGVSYEINNLELFLDGRYAQMDGENRLNETRSEAEIITGVRYLHDTGVRWEPQAKFFGTVYLDKNGDGMRQPDEEGVPAQIIRVSGHEVKTDANGNFQTPSVGGKSASIILDPNKIPYGHTVTGSMRRDVAILDAGRSVDFGLVSRSSIIGLVFNDLNGNGRYDQEDAGVKDVRVLMDGKTRVMTENGGRFRFDSLPVGQHKVQMDLRSLPIGFLPVGPMSKDVDLKEGVQFRIDFAVTAERTVNGQVFADLNGNRYQDEDETALKGVRVRLGAFEVTVDEEGYYLFERVPAGTHTLTVVPSSVPAGYVSNFSRDLTFTDEPARIEQNLPVAPEGESS